MKVSRTIELEDLRDILRCGALSKWTMATDEQREMVWVLVNDTLASNGKIPTESEVNDFIWFGCDDIFYPEEDEDDEEDVED